MHCLSQLSFPTCAFENYRDARSSGPRHSRLFFRCSQYNLQNGEEDEENDEVVCDRVQSQPQVILVERYGNNTIKRYVLDGDLQFQTLLEEHSVSLPNVCKESFLSDTNLSWLPDLIKDFILPAGFPGSVSNDYLQYMLLQFPTNVTAWICHALVTSSLLKAVGIVSSGSTAAASAAAIRWVSKDGIGAVGRLFIGGRFGNLFDDDPKQWRMYADFIGSVGSIFDLTTQLYPSYFLPLASIGNLAKAVGRGLKDPSFRVIQNHFAISGNLGEVAAKEEVWEVAAQLIGLAMGILILDTPGLVGSYPSLFVTWTCVRVLHLWLRYQSLSILQFNTINLKRARILVRSHIIHNSVPGCVECNKEENILLWQQFLKPRIIFCVSLEEMIGSERSVNTMKKFLDLYAKEKHVLMINRLDKDIEVFVSFKVGATSISLLRSIWQSYWLHENWQDLDDVFDQLGRSLEEMEPGFDDFTQLLSGAGWDLHQINIKVPNTICIEEIISI